MLNGFKVGKYARTLPTSIHLAESSTATTNIHTYESYDMTDWFDNEKDIHDDGMNLNNIDYNNFQ